MHIGGAIISQLMDFMPWIRLDEKGSEEEPDMGTMSWKTVAVFRLGPPEYDPGSLPDMTSRTSGRR